MIPIEAAYKAFCTQRFPLPTESDVAGIERRIGVALPDDFRSYILEFNGGYFSDPDIVAYAEGCPEDALTSLSGIGAADGFAELANPGDLALFTDNDPVQTLPIGYTIMGNLLALITHPEGRGSIVMKKAWSDEWFHLADGIEEFFTLLREPEDDEDEDDDRDE